MPRFLSPSHFRHPCLKHARLLQHLVCHRRRHLQLPAGFPDELGIILYIGVKSAHAPRAHTWTKCFKSAPRAHGMNAVIIYVNFKRRERKGCEPSVKFYNLLSAAVAARLAHYNERSTITSCENQTRFLPLQSTSCLRALRSSPSTPPTPRSASLSSPC